MSYNTHDPFQPNRVWAPTLSPGLGTDSMLLNWVAGMLAQQGIFPQPQGNNSVMDMLMIRNRNIDQHYIMKRALSSSQMASRMGGINMDSPFFQQLYPLLASPDSGLWRMMSPLIGGNPVRAQMGLYADLNGQTLASLGRLGSTTALETDRMMDQLQGRFYRRADFGRYVSSVEAPLRQSLGDAAFEKLNQNWSPATLERHGITRVNRSMGDLLESAITRVGQVNGNKELSDADRTTQIEKIRREAQITAESFLSTISNREAQQKMGKSFADALQSDNAKNALKEFKNEWKSDVQDAFKMIDRGSDFKAGRVPGSIDYRFTRGFNIEDITGAFGHAAAAGMIGRTTGLDIGKFSAQGMGVLDAARGLFGRDLTGRGLTEELNKLIGIGSVDLADAGQSGKLESLLRNVKAMARVAGVSVATMQEIIGEAKQLAAQNPNLPVGIGGFSASGIAIQAISDTTASLSYMDQGLARMLGGPVGITNGRVAGLVQALGEPVSRNLGALYYHAVQTGGAGSQTAQDILRYAGTGDTTSIGFNKFLQSISPSLNLLPHEALNFAQSNPLLANMGLELAPELARAGVGAMKTTMLREWDAYSGRTAGFGRELLSVGLNPKYLTMSESEIIADVQSRLDKPLSGKQRERLLAVVAKARQKEQSGDGLVSITDIMSVTAMPDPRGLAKSAVSLGYDMEFARDFNPRARAAHQRMEEARKNSAKMEAHHAAHLAELNAPMLQRIFQSGVNGTLLDGGTAEIRRLFGGGDSVAAYGIGMQALKDAEKLMGTRPDEEVLGKLFPSLNLAELGAAEGVMGRSELRRVGGYFRASERITKTLASGGIVTYGDLEDFLGKQTSTPSVIAELASLKKHPRTQKVSKEELAAISRRLAQGISQSDVSSVLNKYKGRGVSEDVLRRAALGLNTFDPTGNYGGDYSARAVLDYSVSNLRFASRQDEANVRGLQLASEIDLLSGSDEQTNFQALQKMYQGQLDFGPSGLGRYTSKINADVLQQIANATPEAAVELARSAISQAGLSEEPAELITAARSLQQFDTEGLLTGSRRITTEDLLKAARASKFRKAREAFITPFYRDAGESAWQQMLADPALSGTMHSKLAKIQSEVLGGRQDFSVYSELSGKSPEIASRVAEILMEGETSGGGQKIFDRYLGQYEESRKSIDAGGTATVSSNPLASLDIKGIISAITSLTSAVTSAAKNP